MTYELQVKTRKQNKQELEALRAAGLIPAVIYGPELKENVLLSIPTNAFRKVFNQAGESAIIDLNIEGEKEPRQVLVKDVKYEPVRDIIAHIDFYQFQKGHKLELEAELVFVGESLSVKNGEGVLIKNMDSLKIRCLPKDIISKFEVDISLLKTLDDRITIKDLQIPETIEVMADLDQVIALVSKVEEEKEVAAPVAEAAAGATAAAPGAEGAPAAEVKPEEKKK